MEEGIGIGKKKKSQENDENSIFSAKNEELRIVFLSSE
jgi:hypothetical protein